jgi:solute carrier family 50 protein (sugar transporter)
MGIAVEVFEVVTILTTIMMRVSLFPDWNRWRKNKSTNDMSVWPCVFMFGYSYASLFYAYATDNYVPLFATSMLGVVAGVFMTGSFYLWAADRRKVLQTVAVSIVVFSIITIYEVLALCGVTGQSRRSTKTALGFIRVTCTSMMYASPMATITNVVRTRTSASMPFTMGVMNVLNSFCWGVYGALVNNMFFLVPNIIGVSLGLLQMLVTCIYSGKAPHEELLAATSSECASGEINVIVVPAEQGAAAVDSAANCKGSTDFVALHSPCGEDARPW